MAKWLAQFEVTAKAWVDIEVEGPYRRKAIELAQKEVKDEYAFHGDWAEIDHDMLACEFIPTEDCQEEPDEPVEFYLRRIKAAALPGFERLVYGGKQ